MNGHGMGGAVDYTRFEELPVWKAAIESTRTVYVFTEDSHLRAVLQAEHFANS
jgi:hypothetical protein